MKTNLIINTAAITILIGSMAVSCKKNEEAVSTKQSQIVPVKTLAQDYEELLIDNNTQESTLRLKKGTVISIPAHAFVDDKGNEVKGKVSLKYKEQNDAVDIFGAGIPMEYDSAGTGYVLQTAGMFEINGFDASGKPVFIHPEKQLQITMKSSQNETNYNFYRYDTLAANWVYVDKSIIKKSESANEESTKKAIAVDAPIEPKKYNPDNYVLDMKMDISEFPELQSMKGLMWEYAGKSKENSPESNQWIYKRSWSNIKLELIDAEKSIFKLTLSDNETSYQTNITPVLAGKSYTKAVAEYKKKYEVYSKLYAERMAKEGSGINQQNIIYRTVGIAQFGIYNHDRLYRNSNPSIVAKFQLENGDVIENQEIYHLAGQAATVIRYPKQKWQSFAYPDTQGNCLIVFLNDGKVAMFSNTDFEKLNSKQILKDRAYTFKLKTVSTDVINADALRKMMKI